MSNNRVELFQLRAGADLRRAAPSTAIFGVVRHPNRRRRRRHRARNKFRPPVAAKYRLTRFSHTPASGRATHV